MQLAVQVCHVFVSFTRNICIGLTSGRISGSTLFTTSQAQNSGDRSR